MKNAVIIKSFHNGISVYLDNELDFDTLLGEIAMKFKESEHFFRDGKMAVSFEGRSMTEEQERIVVEAITVNSGLDIVCIVGKDEDKNQAYLKAINQVSSSQNDNDGQFYRGTLKDGQIFETEKSIIILGDVNPGSSVISNKDIIILGGLYGEAYAGGNGESNHFIVALEMSPEKLKIGDFKYRNTQKPKWSIKPKVQPKIAFVRENKVVMENLTKELLNGVPF